MTYYGIQFSGPHLEHHGILGMKWGVRRYQNKDGSLTAAGRKRYYQELAANNDIRLVGRGVKGDISKISDASEFTNDAVYLGDKFSKKVLSDVKDHYPNDYKKMKQTKQTLKESVQKDFDKLSKKEEQQWRKSIDKIMKDGIELYTKKYGFNPKTARQLAALNYFMDPRTYNYHPPFDNFKSTTNAFNNATNIARNISDKFLGKGNYYYAAGSDTRRKLYSMQNNVRLVVYDHMVREAGNMLVEKYYNK